MIDHSENGEGVILWDMLDRAESGFFIDVGANDGPSGSNTWGLYEIGWHGIFVEPDPGTFAALAGQCGSRAILIRAAVGNVAGVATFYREGHRNSGWSTLDRQYAEGIKAASADGKYEPCEVPVITLDSLGAMVPPGGVDLLSIDAEGMDTTIIGAMQFDRICPRLIIVEASSQAELDITSLLERQGYIRRWRNGANVIYGLSHHAPVC